MRHHAFIIVITATAFTALNGMTTITYEDAPTGTQGYINDAPYTAAGVIHANTNPGGYWYGFATSDNTNTTPSSFVPNEYISYAGGGAGGSSKFAVGYWASYDPTATRITFATSTHLADVRASFTNTTAAALDMLIGSRFGKKFGGASGDDADWFLLTISGYLGGTFTGSTELYLADYRFSDNSQDYIIDTWTDVSFSPLGTVDEIRFTMDSSDYTGIFMNTPSYFAMDNLVVPEPSSLTLGAFAGLFLLRRRRAGK